MLLHTAKLAALLAAIQQCAAVAVAREAAPNPGSDAVSAGPLAKRKDWESPVYNYLYQFPLPVPKAKTPK